ncbi:uncharacterized protein LOC131172042 [Hevea brasiliensis]|uniref:uncharacterized protein LOC131172042 n=1 Tax=Hevea brasiliensis TaxID=3981 RepID=UPI0025E767C7|nr:uncharacterized protein LOC131172042 [Hevea brasiliensis]
MKMYDDERWASEQRKQFKKDGQDSILESESDELLTNPSFCKVDSEILNSLSICNSGIDFGSVTGLTDNFSSACLADSFSSAFFRRSFRAAMNSDRLSSGSCCAVPVSKPSQITKPAQQEPEDNRSEFIAALKDLLKKAEEKLSAKQAEEKLSVNPVTVKNKTPLTKNSKQQVLKEQKPQKTFALQNKPLPKSIPELQMESEFKISESTKSLQKEEIVIQNLSTNSSTSSSNSNQESEENIPLQKDGLVNNSSDSDSKIESEENAKNVHMLLKSQELILDVLKHEENPENQKKLQNPPVQCLQREIKITKNELKQLKEKKAQDSKAIHLLFSKPQEESEKNKKNRADLNCIKEGIVPKKFHKKITEKLSAANNSKWLLAIRRKPP